jgi:DNA-directed RNA polymerase subunit alpha
MRTENMRVGERTDFDRLFLEIETDGTITPEEAFLKACEILINQFSFLKENLEKHEEKTQRKKTE